MPKSPKLPPAIPPDLSQALAASPAALARFMALPPSHQREHISYIEEAKKPETRSRRIARTVGGLSGSK